MTHQPYSIPRVFTAYRSWLESGRPHPSVYNLHLETSWDYPELRREILVAEPEHAEEFIEFLARVKTNPAHPLHGQPFTHWPFPPREPEPVHVCRLCQRKPSYDSIRTFTRWDPVTLKPHVERRCKNCNTLMSDKTLSAKLGGLRLLVVDVDELGNTRVQSIDMTKLVSIDLVNKENDRINLLNALMNEFFKFN